MLPRFHLSKAELHESANNLILGHFFFFYANWYYVIQHNLSLVTGRGNGYCQVTFIAERYTQKIAPHTSVGWPARTYLQQLCIDMGCSFEDLLGVMDNRNKWRESQGNLCKQCDLMMDLYTLKLSMQDFFTLVKQLAIWRRITIFGSRKDAQAY